MKLLVIDIQKGITDERLYNFENFIKNTVRLINAARQNKVEVIYVQHDDGEDTLMIVGLQTNFCIDASVKSAFERGFTVIIPAETNSTFSNDYMDGETTYKYYNEMMWPKRFAKCISVDNAVEMLRKHAL